MNQATRDVIEFLTHPELNFGNLEDVDLLDDPEMLQQRVRDLLDQRPAFLMSREAREELRTRLEEVHWSAVAEEFRTRLQMASQFFGKDAESHRDAGSTHGKRNNSTAAPDQAL